MASHTTCDDCNKEFIGLAENGEPGEDVHIHIKIDSDRRSFDSGEFSEGDFCSFQCAKNWLTKADRKHPNYTRPDVKRRQS